MEEKRSLKKSKGKLVMGQIVVSLNDGIEYYFIKGTKSEKAVVATTEMAEKGNKLRIEDEEKRPMLSGRWYQYLTKDEKVSIEYDSLIDKEEYDKAINIDSNKKIIEERDKSMKELTKLIEKIDLVKEKIKEINIKLKNSV